MTQNLLALLWDAWRTRKKGADAVADASVPVSPTWLPMPGQFAVLRLNSIVICQIGLNGPSTSRYRQDNAHGALRRVGVRPCRHARGFRLEHVVVERGGGSPAQSRSGRLREVIPLSKVRIRIRFREMNDERERGLQVLRRPFSQPSAQL